MGKVPPILPSRKWGNISVQGKPRTGKTAQAKSLVVQIGQYRKVIIFDCNSEWCNHVTEYNWNDNVAHPKKLINYKIVDDFAFQISEFTTTQDWISFGFTVDAANILGKLAKADKYHEDDVEKFREMVREIPEGKADMGAFNAKFAEYGIKVDHAIFPATKVSMLTKMDRVEHWFHQGHREKRKYYDFLELLKQYDHLIIDLTFQGSSDVNYQQAMVGKILGILAVPSLLLKHKPFLVFEESANLFPDYSQKNPQETPSSVLFGREFAWKFPKYDVSTMMIFQMESQIDTRILEHAHLKILFPGASGRTSEFKLAKHLLWEPDKNRRSAVFIRENGTYAEYEPFISPCLS